MTNEQKKDLARLMYVSEPTSSQKEVASRVGVSEQTMSKWVREDQWDKLRRSKLASRQQELANAYLQLEELNTKIMARAQGSRFPDSKEADTLLKLSAHIRNLETKMNVAVIMDVGIHFVDYVRSVAPDKSADVLDLYDSFMKHVVARS